mgnify:CR=1 FL=1
MKIDKHIILSFYHHECYHCNAPNKALIYRVNGKWHYLPEGQLGQAYADLFKPVIIVLAIAYLDHNIENTSLSNTIPLCQKCYRHHIIKQYTNSRRYGKSHKRDQIKIF